MNACKSDNTKHSQFSQIEWSVITKGSYSRRRLVGLLSNGMVSCWSRNLAFLSHNLTRPLLARLAVAVCSPHSSCNLQSAATSVGRVALAGSDQLQRMAVVGKHFRLQSSGRGHVRRSIGFAPPLPTLTCARVEHADSPAETGGLDFRKSP